MKKLANTVAIVAVLAVQGCSSRPREFTPTFTVPQVSQSALDQDLAACQTLYAEGKLDASGRLASAAGGVAAGATVGALGAAAATSAGLYGGGVALASATVVLLPFAVIGGAVGMARIKRHRKEAAIQRVMAGCLTDRGYTVSGWTRAPKRNAGVATPPQP